MTVLAKRLRRALGAALTGALLSGSASAQDFPDVTAISLEDLMNLKVWLRQDRSLNRIRMVPLLGQRRPS